MAYAGFYAVGLASSGDQSSPADLTHVLGNGTLWGTGTGNVYPGDMFSQGGVSVPIDEVVGDEELVLAYAWPGAVFEDAPYVIIQSSPDRYDIATVAQSQHALRESERIREGQAPIFPVEDFGVNTPPVSGYAIDEMLVVGTAPTGDFTGHANEVARKTLNGWYFNPPAHGWIVIDKSTTPNIPYNWDAVGAEWVTTGSLLGAPHWAGAWDSGTTYNPGDLVSYLNKIWAADVENTNSAPGDSPSDWTVFLQIGEHGGAVTLAYTFRTDTPAATADTAGQLNLDAAPGSATKLYLNKVDAFGNDWAATLASLADGTSARLGRVHLKVPGEPSRQWTAAVTAVVASGTRFELTLEADTVELAQDALVDLSAILFMWTDAGDVGATGGAGATGERGAVGGPIAIPYTFSIDTPDTDPTPGKLRLDNATQNLATTIRADLLNSAAGDVTTTLDGIPAIGTGIPVAIGSLVHATTPESKWLTFKVTAYATPTGYRNLTIEVVGFSAANPFADADPVVLVLMPVVPGETGDTGPTGATGAAFEPDFVVATLDLRDAHDGDANGTSVLVEIDETNGDKPTLYFLETPGTGSPPEGAVWSQGIDFITGATLAGVEFDDTISQIGETTAQGALDEAIRLARLLDTDAASIASAATTDIFSGAGDAIKWEITGTVGITSLGSGNDKIRIVKWIAESPITHNGTTLNLINSVSRTNVAGTWSIFASDSSGNVTEIYHSQIQANPAAETVASAATTDIGATAGQQVTVSGTVTITSFGTKPNRLRFVRFSGATTLTYNATSLILLGGLDRLTAANDVGIFQSDSSGNWREISYFRATHAPAELSSVAFTTAGGATTDIGATNSIHVIISGSPTITSFGTSPNRFRIVRFGSGVTLTDNANIILLGSAPTRLTTTGDWGIYASNSAGAWRELAFFRGGGEPAELTSTPETVASATTADIGATNSIQVTVSGTTTITGFGTKTNRVRIVLFSGALLLTHNATSLILLGGANRTTAAGDVGIYQSDSAGNWREVSYQRATPFGTFTPTVTLVGGAGNTVPVYVTNDGRFDKTGARTMSVDIYLTGDGGAEGAGSGILNVALPVAASASHPTQSFPAGYGLNGAASYLLQGSIIGGGTTISLTYFSAITTLAGFTGAEQNNTSRVIRLKFFYEV